VSEHGASPVPRLSLVPKDDPAAAEGPHFAFRLYVAGDTPKSLAATANLRRLCASHLADRHSIEVVDLVKNPELAQSDQILAVPTLVRRLPLPARRVIGTLADTQKVLLALDLTSDSACRI
jgi:circadian clock protein KaiB